MREQGYEFFDHTADVGIRAEGATLAELLVHLAQGLTELLVEESRIAPRQARAIELAADDAQTLALRWLQELLYWFSVDRFVPAAFSLREATPSGLRGEVRGEAFDPSRHQRGREVKAITRHLFQVREAGGRWEGQVIVDI